MDKATLIRAARIKLELLRRSINFAQFVKYLKGDDYEMTWYHKMICDRLDLFAQGKVKKMMILLPPQCGKTELATRSFPPFILGRNPDQRIAIASYNQSMASGFNRAIQRNIDNTKYALLFPDTKLNLSDVHKTNVDGFSRTDRQFDIVNKKGSVKTVGRGGPLTGNPVDIGIIDDLYKDRAEANSMAISQSTWEWYTDVFKTRMHNDSQQLIMNTRWAEDDLCGRLLIEEKGEWEVIKLPAIRTEDVNDYDQRELGEALWPQRHSLERLLAIKSQSEVTFNSLYQQDPKPAEKLMVYNGWVEIPDNEWPEDVQIFWGLDFGYTNDPTALVKCCVVGNKAYFHECSYHPGIPPKTIKQILEDNGYQSGQPVYCDHDKEIIFELRVLGITALQAAKNIQAGIQKVQEYKCHYTSSSLNLKNELNNYKWVAYGNVITNEPEDAHNHQCDALRYGIFTRFFRSQN